MGFSAAPEASPVSGGVEEVAAGTVNGLTGDDKRKGDGEMDEDDEEGDKEELQAENEEL
jgi:hypothetical protein